jgi:poly(3-hydroxybutyrate) depolymerase
VAAGRPASVRVPSDYDPNVEYPLVILLHGYSASGGVQNIYFGLSNQVTALGFILVIPDGTVNSEGRASGTPPMRAATSTRMTWTTWATCAG